MSPIRHDQWEGTTPVAVIQGGKVILWVFHFIDGPHLKIYSDSWEKLTAKQTLIHATRARRRRHRDCEWEIKKRWILKVRNYEEFWRWIEERRRWTEEGYFCWKMVIITKYDQFANYKLKSSKLLLRSPSRSIRKIVTLRWYFRLLWCEYFWTLKIFKKKFKTSKILNIGMGVI